MSYSDKGDRECKEIFSGVFEALKKNRKPVTNEAKEFVRKIANDAAEAFGVAGDLVDIKWRPEFGTAHVVIEAEKLNVLNPVAFSNVLRRALNFDVCDEGSYYNSCIVD